MGVFRALDAVRILLSNKTPLRLPAKNETSFKGNDQQHKFSTDMLHACEVYTHDDHS